MELAINIKGPECEGILDLLESIGYNVSFLYDCIDEIGSLYIDQETKLVTWAKQDWQYIQEMYRGEYKVVSIEEIYNMKPKLLSRWS